MRSAPKWILLAALFAVSLHAQTADQTKKPRNSIDNPLVQVREVIEQPHQPSAPREHPMNRVLVFRQAGQMTRTIAGKVEKLTFQAGEARWDPAGPAYVSENITDHPIEVVEIELKNTPKNPPLVLSNLDMLVSDPQHYKLVFENAQVRVLKVHYGPHEQGGRHEHARLRVVVNLSDELRAKYGDVGLIQPETHSETNNTDHAVDRLVIELK